MMLMLFTSFTPKAATDSEQMSSTLVEKQQKKPLNKRQLRAFTFTPAVGYLKADKKKPGIPAQGLIRVNCLNNTQTLDKQLTVPFSFLFLIKIRLNDVICD